MAAATRSAVPSRTFAVRQFRFWLTDYRRTWRGSIYSSLLNPVLFLGAMGLFLGDLVDAHGTASLGVATVGGALIHVGYLAGLAAIGVVAGNRSYRRRLYV